MVFHVVWVKYMLQQGLHDWLMALELVTGDTGICIAISTASVLLLRGDRHSAIFSATGILAPRAHAPKL